LFLFDRIPAAANVDCFDYIQAAGDVYLFQSGYLWSFLPEDTSNRLSI
jgi:hypothetical protein